VSFDAGTGQARPGKRTVRLTTRGRKSGRPRTVKLWFVPFDATTILVQHTSATPAQWYHNLLADPVVQVDFGDGPRAGRAIPITDPERVREVLSLIRRKYPLARVIQWLGRKVEPVAAEVRIEPGSGRDTGRRDPG
jgi:deazaflavin-dependent oxidoreductase (nitroreductase family)